MALTLDGASENGVAGGPAAYRLPPPRPRHAPPHWRSGATPEELALGKGKFDVMCVICHGEDGKGLAGGAAPPVTGRTDFTEIKRVIAQGQGEMPALGNSPSPAEIEAIAKHVVKTLGPQQRSLNNRAGRSRTRIRRAAAEPTWTPGRFRRMAPRLVGVLLEEDGGR